MASSTNAVTGKHDTVTLAFESEGCVMATWKNLMVVAWAKAATLEISKKLETASVELIRAYPQGISSVHVIFDKTPLPAADARNHLREITERYAANLACVGTVIDGGGFWASAMRSFLTSLHWLSRRPFKAHYASSIAELADWLPPPHAQKTGVIIQPAEFATVMAQLSKAVRSSMTTK
jgi:hypothetical protein